MKRLGNIIFWVIVISVALFALYTFYNRYNPQNVELGQIQEKITAHDFTLTDLDGKTVKLSDFRGKIVFVNFWASWCPPCREEMPDLDKAAGELAKGGDAVFLAVNITDGARETEDKVREFIKENKFSMRVLLDHGGKVAGEYNVTGIPTTYIINRDGTVYNSVTGPVSEKTVLNLTKGIK